MLIAIFEIICQSLDIQQLFQKAEVRDLAIRLKLFIFVTRNSIVIQSLS